MGFRLVRLLAIVDVVGAGRILASTGTLFLIWRTFRRAIRREFPIQVAVPPIRRNFSKC